MSSCPASTHVMACDKPLTFFSLSLSLFPLPSQAVFSGGNEGIVVSYKRGAKGFLGEHQWCAVPCPQEQLFAMSRRTNGDIVNASESPDRLSIEVWLVHRKDAFRSQAAKIQKASTLHTSTIALNRTAGWAQRKNKKKIFCRLFVHLALQNRLLVGIFFSFYVCACVRACVCVCVFGNSSCRSEYLAFSDKRKLRVLHIEWANGAQEVEMLQASPLAPAENCPPLDCSHFSDQKTLIGATADGRLLAMRLPELDSVFISDMKMPVTKLASSQGYLAALPCSLDAVHIFVRRISNGSIYLLTLPCRRRGGGGGGGGGAERGL